MTVSVEIYMLVLLDFSMAFDLSDLTFGVPPRNSDPEPMLYLFRCVATEMVTMEPPEELSVIHSLM